MADSSGRYGDQALSALATRSRARYAGCCHHRDHHPPGESRHLRLEDDTAMLALGVPAKPATVRL